MLHYKRSQRVAHLLQAELSAIIAHQLKDPLIGLATVSEVNLTEDLKYARVYVSIIGDEQAREQTLRGLERAKAHIRTELGRRLDLRRIPQLEFRYDASVDQAQRIESLLKRVRSS